MAYSREDKYEELWTRRITAELTMLRRTTTTDDLEIIKEIKRNNIKEQPKFTEITSGSYIEYQERFSVTEGHNLHQNSWENLQKY